MNVYKTAKTLFLKIKVLFLTSFIFARLFCEKRVHVLIPSKSMARDDEDTSAHGLCSRNESIVKKIDQNK